MKRDHFSNNFLFYLYYYREGSSHVKPDYQILFE